MNPQNIWHYFFGEETVLHGASICPECRKILQSYTTSFDDTHISSVWLTRITYRLRSYTCKWYGFNFTGLAINKWRVEKWKWLVHNGRKTGVCAYKYVKFQNVWVVIFIFLCSVISGYWSSLGGNVFKDLLYYLMFIA